jgi:predicted metal-dependent hydrolase
MKKKKPIKFHHSKRRRRAHAPKPAELRGVRAQFTKEMNNGRHEQILKDNEYVVKKRDAENDTEPNQASPSP